MERISDPRWSEYRSFMEDYLAECIQPGDQPQKVLYEAMGYSLLAAGKRLRPILVFEFCRLCGGQWQTTAPFAAAIEMIHTYSLIHDDLPCMDNDDYRRGALTNHKVYGEAVAVLAGDALLTDAFARAASMELSAERLSLAIGVLAENAGSGGMVGGQVLDMHSESRECTEQEILDIQTRKTGALFNAACVLGVIAGGGSEEQIQSACAYAAHFGLAFQIRDDMLDVIGSAEKLGKAVGVDGEKNTFVRLYGLEKCEELVQFHTTHALQALETFPNSEALAELTRSLTQRMR